MKEKLESWLGSLSIWTREMAGCVFLPGTVKLHSGTITMLPSVISCFLNSRGYFLDLECTVELVLKTYFPQTFILEIYVV